MTNFSGSGAAGGSSRKVLETLSAITPRAIASSEGASVPLDPRIPEAFIGAQPAVGASERARVDAAVVDAPAKISEEAFRLYGASTTPTLVLVDRRVQDRAAVGRTWRTCLRDCRLFRPTT